MFDFDRQFTLDELCSLYELNKRQIRAYIQQGLVDQPYGSGRNTYYTQKHVEQLLAIHKRNQAGLPVDRPSDVRSGMGATTALGISRVGNIETWTHLVVDHGIELHIEASAGLTPEESRDLLREVCGLYHALRRRKRAV